MDVVAVVILAVLFTTSVAYVHGCDRLKGTRP